VRFPLFFKLFHILICGGESPEEKNRHAGRNHNILWWAILGNTFCCDPKKFARRNLLKVVQSLMYKDPVRSSGLRCKF
jgi:hypothetical protein